jgi:hypothetical protein
VIQHYLARRRDKENRQANQFHQSKVRFRQAILAELSIILLERAYWPRDIAGFLLQAVPKLQFALQIYRPYIRGKELAAFDKAWEGFVTFCNQRIADYHYAAAKMYPEMPGENPAKILREHINQLLFFA